MKKILSVLIIGMLFIPGFISAKLDQSTIQKEMIIAKHEITKLYGIQVNNRLDQLFAQKIDSNDMELFTELQGKLRTYFTKIPSDKILTKKEKLYKYLYIRVSYELSFR